LPNGSDPAGQLRKAGQLLDAYVTKPAPSYRYSDWQFGADGEPIDHLTEILSVLREFGPFEIESDGLARSNGWGEAEWFLSPHALLDGVAPAEALATDPALVLRVARSEFEHGNSWLRDRFILDESAQITALGPE